MWSLNSLAPTLGSPNTWTSAIVRGVSSPHPCVGNEVKNSLYPFFGMAVAHATLPKKTCGRGGDIHAARESGRRSDQSKSAQSVCSNIEPHRHHCPLIPIPPTIGAVSGVAAYKTFPSTADILLHDHSCPRRMMNRRRWMRQWWLPV